jgi:hypothetical protein
MKITAGQFLLIQLDQRTFADATIQKRSSLLDRSIAPKHVRGLAQFDALVDPVTNVPVDDRLGPYPGARIQDVLRFFDPSGTHEILH